MGHRLGNEAVAETAALRRHSSTKLPANLACSLLLLLLALAPAFAATPEAARLLPPDTLFLLTAPNYVQAEAAFTNLPMARLWRDPAMRAPADRLERWWRDDFIARLNRHWGFSLNELHNLIRGQVIFALLPGQKSQREWLLLADVGDRASLLATNLARFRKAWQVNGRTLRTETVQGQEVMVLTLPEEVMPADLRATVNTRHDFNESIAPKPVTPRALTTVDRPPIKAGEVRLVQAGSCLLVGSSSAALGAVLARLARKDLPVLADQAAYTRQSAALAKDAPLWGWADARTVLDLFGVPAATNAISAESLAGNPGAAVFLSPGLGQLGRAVGLGTMQTAAFSLRSTAEGTRFDLRLTSQDRAPRNLLAALAGPPADLAPPAFVPADALEFDRVRWTASNLPSALEQAFDDFSPRFGSAVNFLLDTANDAAKSKDATFDLRGHLRAGLGEELLRWDRLVGDASTTQSVRRVLVFPSPAPERMVAALRALFVLFPQQEGDAIEREFLTRKIYSVPLPPLPGTAPPTGGLGTLYYAASTGHVILSTAESLVEEFLRHGDTTPKPLKDVPGLQAAREKVVGPGARAAGCWNETALGKSAWATLRHQAESGAALAPFLPLPEVLGRAVLEEASIPSLAEGGGLPAFDAVAKYFHLSVYALAVDANGVTLRYFAPTPPGLERK